jgi:hypothetical protein
MGLIVALTLTVPSVSAQASPGDCLARLDELGVSYRRATQRGVVRGVEIQGTLGGVEFVSSHRKPLVIDCSLAVSLAEAGPYLRRLGIERASYSSAYARRNVRGTKRPSKHSYGLAIDVHSLSGGRVGNLRVDLDYEQGLGDAVDCLGQPASPAGAILKTVQCQLIRSGLFHLVLSPDYDDAHHDHFHLEASPWQERAQIRATRLAIH